MFIKHQDRPKHLVQTLMLSSMIGFVLSCGGSSKSDGGGSDTPAATTETTKTSTSTSSSTTTSSSTSSTSTANSAVSILNSLAAAVPGNLSLVAFSTGTSASLHLDEGGDELSLQEDASKIATTTPEAELKEKQGILKGTAESCLAAGFKKPPTPPTDELCYEFDSDMIQVSGKGPNGVPKILGTKTGKNASGEACLVAFSRAQIIKIKDPLDRSQAILNAALCQANKDEKEKAKAKGGDETKVDLMPAKVGDSIDLAPYLKNALTKGGRTKEVVSSITMTRLADIDSQKVYQTVFKMTDDQDNTRVFTLNHSPKDATNEEYNGTLYFAVKPPKGKADPMAGANGDLDFLMYVSIGYARTKNADGTFSMSYEARTGRFSAEIDPILSTGLLDYNANADFAVASTHPKYGSYKKADGTYFDQNNKAGNGFAYITVTNTENSEGKLTGQKIGYWMNPGSNYTENARGMVFSASLNTTTGFMEGCANSGSASIDMGSGISIRRTLKEGDTNTNISLTPRGMYHPFTNIIDTQGGSATITTNNVGTYKYKKVTSNLTTEWAAVQATGTDAVTFVEQQVAALMTSQCFKQNATSGLWEIDTTKTTGADGYDIIKTTDTVKALTPPPPPKPPLQTAGAGKIDFKPQGGKVSLLED